DTTRRPWGVASSALPTHTHRATPLPQSQSFPLVLSLWGRGCSRGRSWGYSLIARNARPTHTTMAQMETVLPIPIPRAMLATIKAGSISRLSYRLVAVGAGGWNLCWRWDLLPHAAGPLAFRAN